jgi:hypothetical protein
MSALCAAAVHAQAGHPILHRGHGFAARGKHACGLERGRGKQQAGLGVGQVSGVDAAGVGDEAAPGSGGISTRQPLDEQKIARRRRLMATVGGRRQQPVQAGSGLAVGDIGWQ